jgi:predicted RNA-binding Zn-ribbon protein involved in translation (DUF1610 family)
MKNKCESCGQVHKTSNSIFKCKTCGKEICTDCSENKKCFDSESIERFTKQYNL